MSDRPRSIADLVAEALSMIHAEQSAPEGVSPEVREHLRDEIERRKLECGKGEHPPAFTKSTYGAQCAGCRKRTYLHSVNGAWFCEWCIRFALDNWKTKEGYEELVKTDRKLGIETPSLGELRRFK